MEIIDKTGRLFGKVNIIDFFVILFFLSLVPMGYHWWRLNTRPEIKPPSLFIKVKIMKYEQLQKEVEKYEELKKQINDFFIEHKRLEWLKKKYFKKWIPFERRKKEFLND